MSYEFIQNFEFKTRSRCIFYTLRDINAFKRNRIFLLKQSANSVKIIFGITAIHIILRNLLRAIYSSNATTSKFRLKERLMFGLLRTAKILY